MSREFRFYLKDISQACDKVIRFTQGLKQNPEIDGRKIAGFRDIAIHDYFGLDSDIIWDIVTTKVPDLKNKIDNLLNKLK